MNYSRTQPNLISSKIKKDISKALSKQANSSNLYVNDNLTNCLTYLYNNYIKPNKILICLLLSLALMLYYKYHQKQKKDIETLEMNKVLLEELEQDDKSLPTLNPLYPTSQQNINTNYLPNMLPMNIDNNGLTMIQKPTQYETTSDLIEPNYNYDNVYQNQDRQYYTTGLNSQTALNNNVVPESYIAPPYNTD